MLMIMRIYEIRFGDRVGRFRHLGCYSVFGGDFLGILVQANGLEHSEGVSGTRPSFLNQTLYKNAPWSYSWRWRTNVEKEEYDAYGV